MRTRRMQEELFEHDWIQKSPVAVLWHAAQAAHFTIGHVPNILIMTYQFLLLLHFKFLK